jgi:hypothetical protein
MTKKRGRPQKAVEPDFSEAVEAEPVTETERFDKRPIVSNVNDKVVITVSRDGRKHIDCGGFTLWDVMMILKGCHGYIINELQKAASLNGSEEGTADTTGGSNT